MSDFHKHFLDHIFEKWTGGESDEVGGVHFDIAAFGEKMALAKSANIDGMRFLERCYDKGMSVKQALAAFDTEVAKIPPKSGAASGAATD